MIERAQVIAAVAAELDARAGRCLEEHGAVGARVADRLGLLERFDVSAEIADLKAQLVADREAKPLNALGTGVFVRRVSDWPIELLARFGWACVAVINGDRRPLNRDRAWWADARAAGVVLAAMDWLPPPGNFRPGLDDAITWSAEQGSLVFVADAETPGPPRGWNGQPTAAARYVGAARSRCDRVGCGLGFTGIAMLPRTREWRTFVESCADLLIPQPYDRWGAYEEGYAERVLERWHELGAQRIALGRGAFVDPDAVGPERARWRTPQEIERHRALTPAEGLVGTCWWPPAGTPSSRVVDAIVRP